MKDKGKTKCIRSTLIGTPKGHIPPVGMRRFYWQKNWKNRSAKAMSKMLAK